MPSEVEVLRERERERESGRKWVDKIIKNKTQEYVCVEGFEVA